MKEYSLLNRKRTPSVGKKTFLAAFGLLLTLSMGLLFFSSSLRGVAVALGIPLWDAERVVSSTAQSLPDNLTSKAALIEELTALRSRLTQADLVLRRFKLLEEENVHLKALLGRQFYESAVLASVLGRPPSTPYDTLLIDLGEEVVAVGDRVTVEGSIVIGTISDVQKGSAQVLLFSAPGVETAALVGPQRIPVTARGQGGGSFIAEFPRDAHVEKGYSVILPGVNPHLFAVVESTEAASSDPFVTIRFKNPLNLQTLVWVQVITDMSEVPPPMESPLTSTSTVLNGEEE